MSKQKCAKCLKKNTYWLISQGSKDRGGEQFAKALLGKVHI